MFAIGIPSGPELLLVAFVVVIIFGLGKLPSAAKDLGLGIRNFRKALKEPEDGDGEGEGEEKAEA